MDAMFIIFIFLFIFFILLFLFGCLLVVNRFKHPFWAIQPVFHYYDLHLYLFNKGIISKRLPEKNRYVNFQKVRTAIVKDDKVQDMGVLWNQMLGCVQTHYLREKSCEYVPTLHQIVPYFVGHEFPCFVSTFVEPEFVTNASVDASVDTLIENKEKVVGVMTSRPLNVCIKTEPSLSIEFPVYYVDFLCVDKMKRKQNVAQQLIQTHEYVQSHQSRKISVSLFKREGELTGIVPLTTYSTYCYPVTNVVVDADLAAGTTVVAVTVVNIRIVYDFLQEEMKGQNLKNKKDIFIMPHIGNLMECIRTDNIMAYMCLDGDKVLACYFFRDTQTFIEDKLVISCFASLRSSSFTVDDFVSGAQIAWINLLQTNKRDKNSHQPNKKEKGKGKNRTNKKEIGYLSVELTSDNGEFMDDLTESEAVAVSPTAYFFYNFAYSPFEAKRCFILC
jgi:hypothetical protein